MDFVQNAEKRNQNKALEQFKIIIIDFQSQFELLNFVKKF